MTAAREGTGAPILIVDDNAVNQKLVRVLLQAEGHDVRVAGGGEEMFRVLESFRPRLILMDIQLPGEDGLQLTRRLKADPATSGIAVVAVTAYAMKDDHARAAAAGCDDYVTKPIDTRLLPQLVARHLARAPGEPPAGAGDGA